MRPIMGRFTPVGGFLIVRARSFLARRAAVCRGAPTGPDGSGADGSYSGEMKGVFFLYFFGGASVVAHFVVRFVIYLIGGTFCCRIF